MEIKYKPKPLPKKTRADLMAEIKELKKDRDFYKKHSLLKFLVIHGELGTEDRWSDDVADLGKGKPVFGFFELKESKKAMFPNKFKYVWEIECLAISRGRQPFVKYKNQDGKLNSRLNRENIFRIKIFCDEMPSKYIQRGDVIEVLAPRFKKDIYKLKNVYRKTNNSKKECNAEIEKLYYITELKNCNFLGIHPKWEEYYQEFVMTEQRRGVKNDTTN